VVASTTLLGDRLVAVEAAEAHDGELPHEAVGAQLDQYNLLLCDQISMGLYRWKPVAPPHGRMAHSFKPLGRRWTSFQCRGVRSV
jgi:hypothetical protein